MKIKFGDNSLNLKVDGSLANIDRGPRGYSAYEIAVQEGFVGTEEEWLASLVGPEGKQGKDGERGIQGPRGQQGDKGDKGNKGDKGDTGNDGHTPVKGVDYFTSEDIASLNIPYSLSDLSDDSTHRTVTDAEKSAWNNKYDKPSSGIPATDLSGQVQTSLGKADTALQEHQDLTDYVKNTDYASSSKGGVIKIGNGNSITANGILYPNIYTYANYQNTINNVYISKGTLENVITGKNLADKNYVDSKDSQVSTMPIASEDNLGKIVQYIGTTTSSYTNGYFYQVVSDGTTTPTYSWENIDVQDSSGGSTYTAGTNIEITNENVINNTIPYKENSVSSISIGNTNTSSYQRSVLVGKPATTYANNTVAIGWDSTANNPSSIALGARAQSISANSIMIGSDPYPINTANIYTSNGIKSLATEDYVNSAISAAITSALGGNY